MNQTNEPESTPERPFILGLCGLLAFGLFYELILGLGLYTNYTVSLDPQTTGGYWIPEPTRSYFHENAAAVVAEIWVRQFTAGRCLNPSPLVCQIADQAAEFVILRSGAASTAFLLALALAAITLRLAALFTQSPPAEASQTFVWGCVLAVALVLALVGIFLSAAVHMFFLSASLDL